MPFFLKARIAFGPCCGNCVYSVAYSVDHVRSRKRAVIRSDPLGANCPALIDDFSVSVPFEAIENE